MTEQPSNWVGDFEHESSDHIPTILNRESVQWAVAQSQTLDSDSITAKWQVYIHGLALAGLCQWLLEHQPGLELNCISVYPCAVLKINQFLVGVLPQGSTGGQQIELPQRFLSDATPSPDCYVHIEVEEELQRVVVRGMLPQRKLMQYQPSLSAPKLSTELPLYLLPIEQFSAAPDHLLLYLRCGRPELLQARVAEELASNHAKGKSVRPVLNVAEWLQAEVEGAITTLTSPLTAKMREISDWILMPTLSLEPSPLMGSVMGAELGMAESLDSMLKQLNHLNILTIPPVARGAAYPLKVGGMELCFYAVTWPIWENPVQLEWSLVLLLGTSHGNPLQSGICLQIEDDSQTLVSATTEDHTVQSYVYGQVIGELNEKFHATIFFPDGTQYPFPTEFTFQPQGNH